VVVKQEIDCPFGFFTLADGIFKITFVSCLDFMSEIADAGDYDGDVPCASSFGSVNPF
jgi:hypothetical protein